MAHFQPACPSCFHIPAVVHSSEDHWRLWKQVQGPSDRILKSWEAKFQRKVWFWLGFPGSTSGKESACQCRIRRRHRLDPCVGKIPWRRKWHPTPVFLLPESQGQWSLVGYGPWWRKESETTEHLSTHTILVRQVLLALWAPHCVWSGITRGQSEKNLLNICLVSKESLEIDLNILWITFCLSLCFPSFILT